MKHEMTLEFVKSNGSQEWVCPICGRRILLSVPEHGMVVIDMGDQNASHYGSAGGLTIGSVEVGK